MSSLIENRISSSILFEDIHIYAHPSVLETSSASSFKIDDTIVAGSASSDDPDAVVSRDRGRYIQHRAVINYTPAHRRESGVLMMDSDSLPVELCRAILYFVDIPSLKNFRLTSRLWAELGEDYLISHKFSSFAYRDDISRLTALAKHPRFRYRIQTLKFLHGEVNEYHARHNADFLHYVQEPDLRIEAHANTYANLKVQKERYLPKSCDRNILNEVFGLLPSLKNVDVSLMTFPFQEDDHSEILKEIWSIPSTRLMPRVATTERFTNLVWALASNLSTASIKSLSHDRLPFEFFAQRPTSISHMSGAFRSLTSLNLAIDYSDMPNNLHRSQAFQNLSLCMRSASQLRSLGLQFIMTRRKIDVSELLFTFRVSDFEYCYLKNIALRGISSTEQDLGTFLVKHKSLKSIQLGGLGLKTRHQPPNGGVHLREGSFRNLFERVKSVLSLDSLRVQGDLVGLRSGERWILENVEDEKDLWEFVMD